MTEHLSNGQFASKEVADGGVKNARKRTRGPGRPFQRGNPGRPKGALGKVKREVKSWMADLIEKPHVQDAIEQRICKGDAVAFLRIVEQIIGRPTERRVEEHTGTVTIKHELIG